MTGRRDIQAVFMAILCAAALIVGPARSAGKVGGLDRSFGAGGVAVASLDFGPARFWYGVRVHGATGPDGRVIVAGDETLVAFRPDGRIDRSFGANGILPVSNFEGTEFALSDLAVDPQGRIVLAGRLATFPEAAVLRLQPDGGPDRTFGGGDGIALTDFGIQPLPGYQLARSQLGVTGVAAGDDGRITVSGRAVRAYTSLCDLGNGFIGRLTPEGGVDQTFAGAGVHVFDRSEIGSVEGLALDRLGAPTGFGRSQFCKVPAEYDPTRVTKLDANGDADPDFGRLGEAEINPIARAIASDRRGRTVVLSGTDLVRLSRSGELDARFGRRGHARLRLAGRRSKLEDLAMSSNGGIVVAGNQVQHSRDSGRLVAKRRMALARFGPRGGFDRRLGIVEARFGRASNAVSREVLLTRGRDAIVVGMVQSKRLPFGQGLALWRFDLGR